MPRAFGESHQTHHGAAFLGLFPVLQMSSESHTIGLSHPFVEDSADLTNTPGLHLPSSRH